ncbi:MAG: epoxyqueuosine reductase QueH [Firmicutes bacterium]|nr:epoxyqueuosine reductase QueH [Bacillota bacterium]
MKTLLHICCGPCATYPVPRLREQGHEVHGYFYNPNIHPYQEFSRRQAGVEQLAKAINLPVIYYADYELEPFLREVVFREHQRCRFCYYLRLKQAAQIARHGKFDAFTTTLLVSPFQKHEQIREIGELVGEQMGVSFYYEDFRPGYPETIGRSKELGLYRQQYCGCIFSEKERYAPKRKGEVENREEKHRG